MRVDGVGVAPDAAGAGAPIADVAVDCDRGYDLLGDLERDAKRARQQEVRATSAMHARAEAAEAAAEGDVAEDEDPLAAALLELLAEDRDDMMALIGASKAALAKEAAEEDERKEDAEHADLEDGGGIAAACRPGSSGDPTPGDGEIAAGGRPGSSPPPAAAPMPPTVTEPAPADLETLMT